MNESIARLEREQAEEREAARLRAEQTPKPEGSGASRPYDIREWIEEHAYDEASTYRAIELLDAAIAQARRDALTEAADSLRSNSPAGVIPRLSVADANAVRAWLRARASEVKS